MRVIGIDPGTACLGYGIIENITKQKFKVITYGCVKTPAHTDMSWRLLVIYKAIEKLIKKHKPDCLTVEKIYFMKNVKTAISVSQARGIILLLAMQNNLQVAEFDPTQVKLAITGYGKADKSQIQKMLRLQLGLEEIPKPDDAADALAVALCRFFIKTE